MPVFDSDADLLSAFFDENWFPAGVEKKTFKDKKNQGSNKVPNRETKINKHGLPFIEDYQTQFLAGENREDKPGEDELSRTRQPEVEQEDFARLLDESLKKKIIPRHIPKPMPLKRRIKRYPPPEADLDLHGFTAVGAQLKARNFISTAKLQGFFTLRIIVGRGLHSQEGPVLPHVVEDLLSALKKENIVLSYEWEGGKKNRSGALIVHLKQFSD